MGGQNSALADLYLRSHHHISLHAPVFAGDLVFVQSQPWTFPLYVTSSGVSGAITQCFLALRIWRL